MKIHSDIAFEPPLFRTNYYSAADALIQVVAAENPPLRLVLGQYAHRKFRQNLAPRARELETWEAIGMAIDFA